MGDLTKKQESLHITHLLRRLTDELHRVTGAPLNTVLDGGPYDQGIRWSSEEFSVTPDPEIVCDCGIEQELLRMIRSIDHDADCGERAPIPGMLECCAMFAVQSQFWMSKNRHSRTCSTSKPNFIHHPSNTIIKWFPCIGQNMTVKGYPIRALEASLRSLTFVGSAQSSEHA